MYQFGLVLPSASLNLLLFQALIWQFSASANYGWKSGTDSPYERGQVGEQVTGHAASLNAVTAHNPAPSKAAEIPCAADEMSVE